MADINLTTTLDGLLAGLAGTAGRVARDAADIVQRAGSRYQSRAQFFAPIDTGELKGSILIDPGGELQTTVTSHAPYSGFVNFGTTRQAPQEFMGESFRSVTPDVVDELTDLGRRIL